MTKSKQQEFKGKGFKRPDLCFGGSLLKGNPKTKRPLDSKMPIHLVLKATQGGMRRANAFLAINQILDNAAKKYGVRIYERANVGNHLHLGLKLTRVQRWAGFIREVTGRIATYMKEIDENWSWLQRPYTRIVAGWKKAWVRLQDYIALNRSQANEIDRAQAQLMREYRALWRSG